MIVNVDITDEDIKFANKMRASQSNVCKFCPVNVALTRMGYKTTVGSLSSDDYIVTVFSKPGMVVNVHVPPDVNPILYKWDTDIEMEPFSFNIDMPELEMTCRNWRTEMSERIKPVVGMGATLAYPQDRYGYVITNVSKSCKVITVRRLSDDVLQPAHYCNGYPVFDHIFCGLMDLDCYEGEWKAYLHKDGRYYLGGTLLSIGTARYYRNYAE